MFLTNKTTGYLESETQIKFKIIEMRKIFLLLIMLGLVIFSCQKTENKKKNWPVASKLKSGEQAIDSLSIVKDSNDVIIKLPNDGYAVITLESYVDDDDHTYYRPKMVKVFDKTKKQVPETLLEGIYYSSDSDGFVRYGDYNFDGKMDIVCQGKDLGYRAFYQYNFYLATGNGYKFSKAFSDITEWPLATLELNTKKKRILATREAEWSQSWEYEVKNNKPKLVRETYDADRHPPFYEHYDSEAVIQNKTVLAYINPENVIISFNTDDVKKSILVFRYDEYDTDNYNLHYAEMINDSLVDFKYSSNFIYDKKKQNVIIWR